MLELIHELFSRFIMHYFPAPGCAGSGLRDGGDCRPVNPGGVGTRRDRRAGLE